MVHRSETAHSPNDKVQLMVEAFFTESRILGVLFGHDFPTTDVVKGRDKSSKSHHNEWPRQAEVMQSRNRD